jgi:uracil-DNA glycosylase
VTSRSVQLHDSWKKALGDEFELPYMQQLREFLATEKAAGKIIYPAGKHIFNAFNSTPLNQVKVVILGQDPYHGPGQAHGLCFSVPPGVAMPPSLKNIFKEIERDLKVVSPQSGCLQTWAQQGVLLLNATLTVQQGLAGSHQGKGWETFTDRAISVVSREQKNVVFMLWGAYAQQKKALVDNRKHLILTSPHPSPLSAHRGFLGNGHFSKANHWLIQQGNSPIQWGLSDGLV